MPPVWRCGPASLPLDRTLVMGVVNVTPDSFSDGGRHATTEAAVAHALALARAGADVLDVGGESTRPGAAEVPAAEELARVLPVIERLAKESSVPISIDTYKSDVAARAVDAGATIVNDISGGTFDPEILRVAAARRTGLVLMHIRGNPRTMQESPQYTDVVAEVRAFLAERARAAEAAGVAREAIALDPGIGFGKTLAHNLALLRGLPQLASLGYPLLVGVSRKSFIGKLTAEGGAAPGPTDRLEGTLAATALAIAGGASVVRVHDVKEAKRAARVADAIVRGKVD